LPCHSGVGTATTSASQRGASPALSLRAALDCERIAVTRPGARGVGVASAARLGSVRAGSLSVEVRAVVCRNDCDYRRTQAVVNQILPF
jgi:hypothetical protein